MQNKLIICVIMLMLFTGISFAATRPSENQELNYRLIPLSIDAPVGSIQFTYEIASGHCTNSDSFATHIIISKSGKMPCIIIEVPCWGTEYSWRVRYWDKKLTTTTIHYFRTSSDMIVDSDYNKLVISHPAAAYGSSYVFVDANRALYDMAGKPVWFLKNIDGLVNDSTNIRDLKATSYGTITFITANSKFNRGYEIDYNCNLLWKTPDSNSLTRDFPDDYHHQFTRLQNGNYMVLGYEMINVEKRRLDGGDTGYFIPASGQRDAVKKNLATKKAPFSTITEYDKSGKEAWAWRSSDFLIGRNLSKLVQKGDTIETHGNAFAFDEVNKKIYVSFRNLNWVEQIDYPRGNVIHTYNDVLYGQHSVNVDDGGILYVYNNNDTCKEGPNIMEFSTDNKSFGLLRNYKCKLPEKPMHPMHPMRSGGNAIPLKNGDVFVSMSVPYSNMFIVNKQDEILWEANLYKMFKGGKGLRQFTTYRASLATKNELENIINKNFK